MNKINIKNIEDLYYEHKWVRYIIYFGTAVIGIWVLGKASRLLSNAVIDFKSLHSAIKS